MSEIIGNNITIDDVDTLINFCNGNYGFGSTDEFLEINLISDLDFAEKGLYSFPGAINTSTSTKCYFHFNGNNHTIKNIKSSGTNTWRMFNNLYDSYIKDLYFDDISIDATGEVTMIRSINGKSEINNIHLKGMLKSTGSVYGLVSSTGSGNAFIRFCSVNGNLFGSSVATIAGSQGGTTTNGRITDCSFIGTINATSNAYCLAASQGSIMNSFFRGTVNAASIYPFCSRSNSTFLSYVVLYEDSTGTIKHNAQIRCFYDSDRAELANLDFGGDSYITPLHSHELRDPNTMRLLGLST